MKHHFFIGMLLGVLALSGCSPLGMLSKNETFRSTDSFAIASPRSDILEVVTSVAKEMGMSVTSFDKRQETAGFRSSSSGAAMLIVGSMNNATLDVAVKDKGKTLDISFSTFGNYGAGGQDAATKLIKDFKNQLAKKLGQSVASK